MPDIENVEGPTQHVNFLFHTDGASTLIISQGDGRLHNSQEIGEYKIIKDIHDMGISQLVHTVYIYILLGGGFKYFLFSPLIGEMIPIDKYFSDGLKPPTSTYNYIQ